MGGTQVFLRHYSFPKRRVLLEKLIPVLLSTDHELIPEGCSEVKFKACRWTENFIFISDKET
jgi:hypothetical protein